jgi:L-fucose isomerase-like protein
MKHTEWCAADNGYFRGGGFSARFLTRAEMPATMIRLNLVKGLGPGAADRRRMDRLIFRMRYQRQDLEENGLYVALHLVRYRAATEKKDRSRSAL